MALSPAEALALFRQHVPEEFLRAFAARLIQSYRGAFALCRETFNKPERHDLQSHVRRATTEAHFRAVAKPHASEVRAARNRRGSAFYSMARFGPVVLTQAGVADENEVVRRAVHRENLAIGQLNLFDPNKPPQSDALLYAILLHGPRETEVALPTFFRVAFPAPDCKSYPAWLPLTYLLTGAAQAAVTTEVEDIEDNLSLRLRPYIEEDDEEEKTG